MKNMNVKQYVDFTGLWTENARECQQQCAVSVDYTILKEKLLCITFETMGPCSSMLKFIFCFARVYRRHKGKHAVIDTHTTQTHTDALTLWC